MSPDIIVDIVGWLGAFALLSAYMGVSSGRIQARTWLYQILNLFGSAFLVVNSGWYRAFPSAFVNVIWISIAIFSLVSVYRRSGMSRPGAQGPS